MSRSIEDGFGSEWMLCPFDDRQGASCGLQVVRPGKVQCSYGGWCPCDLRDELQSFIDGDDCPDWQRRYYADHYGIGVRPVVDTADPTLLDEEGS